MKIGPNSVVSFDYTLTLADGSVADTSTGGEPLTYIHGLGHIVPGLEEAMVGHGVGDSFKVTIPADKAYGDHNESLLRTVPRSAFAQFGEIEPGMMFEVPTPHGGIPVRVMSVNEEEVVLDGNHPLAGQVLTFDVSVTSVREATPEELSSDEEGSCGSGGCSSCSGCGH